MRSRLLTVLFCIVFALAGGCGKSGSARPGGAYLPPELAKRADVSVAEVRAMEFARRASTETFAMYMSPEGLPSVCTRWVRVALESDHVMMEIGFDVSVVGGGNARWEKEATPQQKDQTYQYLCSKMTSSLATTLRIPEELIRVQWQNFNARDQGTFQNGKLTAQYPPPLAQK